ncbi:uncharacterized protein BO66DRAFT_443538 [Aspergillus aculeatinus CBS 121060]|uniref:Uncharacterized protein n=1 Tax=Aspergillus aculeatinus CBS 121060 TaxID=1448322 RepID=A0ACD1GUP6_9EURO|nr:hypothetical protein BO66DRAFT_443538 [Aspergillus aculeatinus CBS 121060]RAH64893.1 hypothetical protein BO66DRAFT_443538 [Aspergillus aculeatinus CBS 121060]
MEKTTHRTLFSFRPHIELVAALIHLARRAHALHPSQSKVRMLLSSSIAVLRYCKNKFPFTVPETPNLDPETVTRMGYAEAKWVCEKLLTRAADQYSSEIEAVALRIGQLSGPERSSGAWKVGEHIPALVQACYHKGAFSHLEGVGRLPPCLGSLSTVLRVRLLKFSFIKDPWTRSCISKTPHDSLPTMWSPSWPTTYRNILSGLEPSGGDCGGKLSHILLAMNANRITETLVLVGLPRAFLQRSTHLVNPTFPAVFVGPARQFGGDSIPILGLAGTHG